jgi:hypothetical protein
VVHRVALDLPKAALGVVVAASPNLGVDRAQVQVLDQRKAEVRHRPRRKAHKVCQYNHGDRSKSRNRKAKKQSVLKVRKSNIKELWT